MPASDGPPLRQIAVDRVLVKRDAPLETDHLLLLELIDFPPAVINQVVNLARHDGRGRLPAFRRRDRT